MKKTIFECDYSGEQIVSEEMPEGWFYINRLEVVVPNDKMVVINEKHFSNRKNFSMMLKEQIDKVIDQKYRYEEVSRRVDNFQREEYQSQRVSGFDEFQEPKQPQQYYPKFDERPSEVPPDKELYQQLRERIKEEEEKNKKKSFWKR